MCSIATQQLFSDLELFIQRVKTNQDKLHQFKQHCQDELVDLEKNYRILEKLLFDKTNKVILVRPELAEALVTLEKEATHLETELVSLNETRETKLNEVELRRLALMERKQMIQKMKQLG